MIRDLRARKLRVKELATVISGHKDGLEKAIMERASLERAIVKAEAYELAKNHDGLCGEVEPDPEGFMTVHPSCERYYKHTGLHSWEGGGVG